MRARHNLAAYGNVTVRCTTGADPDDEWFDAIFVNAGANEVLPSWLDQLCPGGRLLPPPTTAGSMRICEARLGRCRVCTGSARRRSHLLAAQSVILLVTQRSGGHLTRLV